MEPNTFDRILGGRFRLLELIKSDRGIDTWSATDIGKPNSVLVKLADEHAVPRSTRLRVEHETAALRTVSSPCCAPPLAVGRDEGQIFVATARVPGETLAEILGRGPISTGETLRIGQCLLGALAEVHQLGVIHGDIKPSNVVLDASEGRAVLIDFGLARTTSRERLAAAAPPPERTGLADARPDEHADLRAVGAVLFQCLYGHLPAPIDERQHDPEGPPEPQGIAPQALQEVLRSLLHNNPHRRYRSAAGALADLQEIERQLACGQADPFLVVGLNDQRGMLEEPTFVNRAREMADLETLFGRACRGRGGLVLLEAESGMGKTRLLDEFARRRAPGVPLLR
ncbi:MAG TPA: AAA family ATPase, partial [Anaeromyxobacteraceae bacterium]|nr:AAA family ATPase [Anaeromyxobacteraceae bacterium]